MVMSVISSGIAVIDIIEYADDKKHRKRPGGFEGAQGIMVHRCGVNRKTGVVLGYCGPDVLDAFLGRVPRWKKVAKATGGENAYSIYIGGDCGPAELDGLIWQAIPLEEVGYHARRFSAPYIGIGCIGDYRVDEMSAVQYNSLTGICSELCLGFGWSSYTNIKGHGEQPGAHDGSKAPGKPAACPGDLLDMNGLRYDVEQIMQERARMRLHDAGLIFAR